MSLPKFAFRVANKDTQELMDIYDGLYGPSRKGQLNTIGKLQFGRVRQQIEKRLQIVEVTPDKENTDLQEQMAGKFEEGKLKGQCKDQVHEFGMENAETLCATRLGGENSNKTAFALINPDTREVLAAIYVYRSDLAVSPEMSLSERLPGNVYDILREEPVALKDQPTSLVFYSISRFGKMAGEGELLISKLHHYLNEQYADQPEVLFSTLSPFRGFGKWLDYKNKDLGEILPRELSGLALEYLLDDDPEMPKPAIDLVRRFHLSNGAELYGIRREANSLGSKDAAQGMGVMVHYGYPRDPSEMARNALAFSKAGDVRVSEEMSELTHLQGQPLMRGRTSQDRKAAP